MKDFSIRIKIVALFFIVVALLFASRLFYLQIVHGSDYTERADNQYLRPANNLFDRGSIFFTTKDGVQVSAATLKTGFIVAVNPQQITNPEIAWQKLTVFLPTLDQVKFLAQVADQTDPYEEVATHVDKTVADKIKQAKITGVSVFKQKWRFYPAGRNASHAIGFLGYKGDVYNGRYGLEKQYESVLSRNRDGLFVNFFAELFSDFNRAVKSKTVGQAGDIVLTIEPLVQNMLEKELDAYTSKWQPDSVTGIIINPQTGEIYAVASRPNFDPGEKQTDIAVLNNQLVEKFYEMGSIFKPLTMAAALDLNLVTASTTYKDTGCITLNTKKVCNFDGKARGVIPMQEVLSQSLNTGSAFVGLKLGAKNLRDYFHGYGFGEKTSIDLPDEVLGLTTNLDKKPREVEVANMSFGQGIAVTPIQTVRALSVLANGGKLVRPHLVKQINYKNLLVDEIGTIVERHVLKPETSREISRMLTTVVDTKLADGRVKMSHYSIAAKTGTAQIAKTTSGGYYDDRYLHSFFGYFPATNPRFLIFFMSVYPKGATYSSQTLTDPFINLNRFLINYYQVLPDR
ncbi:MAG: Peptidoglycan glycosyltransferase [Parcubacteria group bacterium GW2011_GWC1_43_11b]|uniref:Penicillin-binding protein transpeptidase domain-containing protein n=1 Tax=Candidatus Vogelbacteria bacterium RIFOXYB1_FULL_42_16 TaxID=1802436 RepID=A0A1G2QEH2_9BACT|nr:MAG: Peptidoglycan glycosyltransferase [Parcubacteria group bacterium GW2011_GWB1_42_9]KKS89483.1 MAG: Peptidoglycan glycosyltransferase [Parcubacteria group bacterium GW2011_GWC1_43_11b]KKT10162.1 MAG: Peptidoglycan glycosyltransferase [Parcubacteria group bacterium GW2011_GWA1_43_21]OHA59005.1 MAG: hypothetical protein A2370_00595 [Candidatus Vogelbacteria bacterium RIFOXYB1_FULL_42_16]